MFKAHLQTKTVFPLPCPPPRVRVEKQMGSSPTGGPVYGDKLKLAITINVLELWKVDLAHHCLATLIHCLTAP